MTSGARKSEELLELLDTDPTMGVYLSKFTFCPEESA
jgi:hypothetical protein